MKPEDLLGLAERAEAVEGRPQVRLEQVHRRIDKARRRRQVGAVAATVVAVVLALTPATGVVTLLDTDRTPPAEPAPRPTTTPSVPQDEEPSVRRLTYAQGHKIHWGDRTIDAAGAVGNVAATDDGVVYTRDGPGEESGNCNVASGCFGALWFTDGSELVRIGRAYGTRVRGYQVDFSSAGSLVVWLEPAVGDRPGGSAFPGRGEYVAYDTSLRREVARFGSPDGHVEAVFDDYVYWAPSASGRPWCLDFARAGGQCRRHGQVMRLETATGIQEQVPWAAYVADRRSRPRMFFPSRYTADYPYNAFPSEHPGEETVGLHRDGDRFVADYYGGDGEVTVRLSGTREPVRLRPPRGFNNDTNIYWIGGWLDDHQVVVAADNRDDLAVCRLPDGRCRIAVKDAAVWNFGGRG